MNKKIELLGNRVIVELKEEKNASGLIISTGEKSPDEPQLGVVKAVGPGIHGHGEFIKTSVKEDNNVMFQYGKKINIEGKPYFLLKEDDIVMIIR